MEILSYQANETEAEERFSKATEAICEQIEADADAKEQLRQPDITEDDAYIVVVESFGYSDDLDHADMEEIANRYRI